MARSLRTAVFILLSLVYLAGLAGVYPSGACSCGIDKSTGLECYCCETGGGPGAGCAVISGCHKDGSGGKETQDRPAVTEPLAEDGTVRHAPAAFIDTSARTLTGFMVLPERPPAS